ncbi:P-loop containing nucleoside triphosphate hydrolase [Pseudocohnilembus persalinus]|uniref:p-loop containing nucleoside triphosphate hydrolase n=1 Tax=Pseudocohnilembus persalinus TaxID=266149 RepID=A0A0V0QUM1_PSEPJ|nr:P-loop containing nucleoside triphosphate hydrolase [Pseudocohnilembus persalinus]|eukprot:KRX05557.1 P-loop containing nucleoside triphosphate hydrolase [Pseudocohnilembus persalinus]
MEDVAKFTFNQVFDQNSQQQQVYQETTEKSVENLFQGYNSTIFAYGQTGTGKSFTMLGDEKNQQNEEGQGLIFRVAKGIFKKLQQKNENLGKEMEIEQEEEKEEQKEEQKELEEKQYKQDQSEQELQLQQQNLEFDENSSDFTEQIENQDQEEIDDSVTQVDELENENQVFLSVLQIYNENISDLLGCSQNLKIRKDLKSNYFVEGLSQVRVENQQQVYDLIKKAQKKRASNSTDMNLVSSRSHLIITFSLNIIDKFEDSVISAKLNIVDLAGSEKVKQSKSQGQKLKEACYINSSLFHFSQVIQGLEQKQKGKNKSAVINFRSSKLTTLLQDSIGGNCQTTLIACISPSQQFCKESLSTLNFAHKCKNIQNVVKPNKYKSIIPISAPVQKKKEQDKKQQILWKEKAMDIQEMKVDLQNFKGINIYYVKGNQKQMVEENILEENKNLKNVIFIHGCSQNSNGLEFEHYFKLFKYLKFDIYAVDMPGYGKSEGKQQSFRTLDILKENGPGQVIVQLIDKFNLENVVLVGYDWGGAIALRVGLKRQKIQKKQENQEKMGQVDSIISFMPAYGEKSENMDELRKLRVPVLMQWVKQDQLHNYQKFKKIAEKIQNLQVDMIECKLWKNSDSQNMYEKISERILGRIHLFLEGLGQGLGLGLGQGLGLEVLMAQKKEGKNIYEQKVVEVRQVQLKSQLDQGQVLDMQKLPGFFEAEAFFRENFGENLGSIQKIFANNQMPGSMQMKMYLESLQKLAENGRKGREKSFVKMVEINYQVLKNFLVSQYEEKQQQKKNQDMSQFLSDEDYFDSFKQSFVLKERFFETSYGNVHAYYSLDQSQNQINQNCTIISMHGDGRGRNYEAFLPTVEKFAQKGYNFYSLSMPGYGKSSGNQSAFREYGKEILKEILDLLAKESYKTQNQQKNLIQEFVIMGRSVGGRTAIEFGAKYGQKIKAIILQHPVVPSEEIILSVKKPILLSWAKDDGEWAKKMGHNNAGHPYFGPKGVTYIQKLTGCKVLSWNEIDYKGGPREFFEGDFVENVCQFLEEI